MSDDNGAKDVRYLLAGVMECLREAEPDREFLIASYPRANIRDQSVMHTCCVSCYRAQVELLGRGPEVEVELDENGRTITNGEAVH